MRTKTRYIPYESIDYIEVEYDQDENDNIITEIKIFTQKDVFLSCYIGGKLTTKLNTMVDIRIVFIRENGTSWTMTPLNIANHLNGVNKICDDLIVN